MFNDNFQNSSVQRIFISIESKQLIGLSLWPNTQIMLVFKFGGASVKNADAVRNVAKIIQGFQKEKIVVVVSAMGKMTNKLEELVLALQNNDEEKRIAVLSEIHEFHFMILKDLFDLSNREAYDYFSDVMNSLIQACDKASELPPSMAYDAIVPFGEILSTTIVSRYLGEFLTCAHIDASSLIVTDSKFKSATVDMKFTEQNIRKEVSEIFNECNIVVTQGFIGADTQKNRTTLGREGSDYTGAIFAYCLNAKSLTIWKDVDGMFNADPKAFPKAQKIDEVSYKDAIELSYYGASVIHPKTIQPLQNKNIPLYVKSFLNPSESGTVIQKDAINKIPFYIIKKHQVLVSLSSKDFSFIAERHLSEIFGAFDDLDMKINIMQNSAVNFSALFDEKQFNEKAVMNQFGEKYSVLYNLNLELVTIRQYNEAIIDELTRGKEILLEQRTRETVRFVVR